MPFTPFHMGPGLLFKSLLQGSFSLMVFGWTQIVMDIQPLVAILSRQDRLHGFTHTYVGAALIAVFSAVSGKYLSQWALGLMTRERGGPILISWWVAVSSAFIGSFSHVMLDSLMHRDMRPLLPFNDSNILLGLVSVSTLYSICVYSAVVGAVIYFVMQIWVAGKKGRIG
jgi:LexA-binding, inner membrane-associated putative hydrolase